MGYEDLNGEDILFDTMDAYDDSYDDSYDDDYDDYSESEDDYSERRRTGGRGRRTRPAQGARGSRMNRTSVNRYSGKATINTPAGKAQVALPPDLVTKKELKELEAKVLANNKAILKNGKAISVLNINTKRLDDGLAAHNRSAEGIKKTISGIQQGQMFSALLPPKLEKIKVYGGAAAIETIPKDEAAAIDVKVKSSSFDSLNTLLPLMISGGMSGGTGSSNNNSMNMMLPLVLLMNDKKEESDDKNDNTMLLVVMMMMMNNK